VPYTDDVTARQSDLRCACFGGALASLAMVLAMPGNLVGAYEIRQLLRAADSGEAECVVVICTGLPAALVVEEMEAELGKPIFDSVAVTLWRGLQLAGVSAGIDGWGQLLRA
jgi:maleate isomerase